MIFDTVPLARAEGAYLAHSVRLGRTVFRKGRRLSADDVAALRAAGLDPVMAAVLEPGDVHEDAAAARIAAAVAGTGLDRGTGFTGRVNLHAQQPGLLVIDTDCINAINRQDESVTIATLPPFARVEARQMVATVKIIPFAAPEPVVRRCEMLARPPTGPGLRVAPFRGRTVALIQTTLPGLKATMLDKTVLTTAERLSSLGSSLIDERRCAHEINALRREIEAVSELNPELLLIAAASAITDRRDVLPAAIEAAGGTIRHFGMPVDPGNLLLVAERRGVPVLGLPGCARSPKTNGIDWVLERLMADLPVGPAEIMGMGIGGLLMEMPSRPQPRDPAEAPAERRPEPPGVAALVLAAGQSRRMGGPNKLLATVGGKPLVRHAVEAALASAARPVLVVTGHQHEAVEAALADLPVRFVHNPAFADGLSTSLRAGLGALPERVAAALILLGDMPLVGAAEINRMIAAYNPVEGRSIVVATHRGKRGNPVLWDRHFFDVMRRITGDVGARHLIGNHAELVAEVEMPDRSVLVDIDTPQALKQLVAETMP